MDMKLKKTAIWGLALACLVLLGMSWTQDSGGQPGKAEPVKATGEIKPPKLLKTINPVYPEDARKEGIEGVVILEVTADVEGRVANVKVLHSILALDQAAIDAVKRWLYGPLILDGKLTRVIFTVTVRFMLK
jgi:protein TonB